MMDETIFRLVNGMVGQYDLMDWVMYQSSQESNLLFPVILAIGYWCWVKWTEARWGIPFLGGIVGVGDFIGGQAKWLIGRPRPCQVLTEIQELVGCGGTFSMPSNHAVNSSAAVGFLVVLYPSLGWILWPLMGLIGFSRIYVGAHYLTDVMMGWLMGLALGGGVALILKKKIFAHR